MAPPKKPDKVADAAQVLASVNSALAEQKEKTVFAIGGSIPSTGQRPIVLRWDSNQPANHGRSVSLPVPDNSASKEAFSQLLVDCAPATFGLGKKEVLDETYRKASKMDPTKFALNFGLHEHGVLEAVTQALVHTDYRGLRAELYSLNIYSAPSGKFRPHVDTPRSELQMGSLVICLPQHHAGGQLAVRHTGREVIFDWSKDSTSIQWAAFFSDCEHEVLEVTSGHRITLTYNLFWTTHGPAHMAKQLGIINPFSTSLEALLQCPSFLPGGGTIGFSCAHAYPIVSRKFTADLDHTLKGIDMLVYQALRRLTAEVRVVSILHDDEYQEYLHEEGYMPRSSNLNTSKVLVGTPQSPTKLDEYEHYKQRSAEDVSHWQRKKVTWLNEDPGKSRPANDQLAMLYIAHGNEPSIEACYASAAIVAEIAEIKKPGTSGRKEAA